METEKRPQTKEQRQKQAISRLTNENAQLRVRNKELEKRIENLENKLEQALLYIEKLQKAVFRGKGKKDRDNDDDKNDKRPKGNSGGNNKRGKESYRRPKPQEDEITDEEKHNIENCPDCNTELRRVKILEFFIEDILPVSEWYKVLKKVIRQKITTGYCSHCKKKVSAIPIPKQKVSIGQNIRRLIVFQSTIQQLSWQQIIDFAQSCFMFDLSNGEIINILEGEANKLKPAFEDLKQGIRGQPAVHIDESGWRTLYGDQGNYVWAMTGTEGPEVLYLFGRSRGKGNAEEIIGESFNGIGITDGYRSYKNLFQEGKHALCWAHPNRDFRDLKEAKCLSAEKKQACKETYKDFKKLYKDVRDIYETPFIKEKRLKQKEKLMRRFEEIMRINKNDPEKLKTYKNTLMEERECYFVSITNPDIPPDNNKAERVLRHLVIKRKKSLGSKTQKGADIFSIIYSVVMSLWYRDKENFFANYELALA